MENLKSTIIKLKDFLIEKPLLALTIIGLLTGTTLTLRSIYFDYLSQVTKFTIQTNNCQLSIFNSIDFENPLNNDNIATDGLNCFKNINSKKSNFEFIKEDILNKKR